MSGGLQRGSEQGLSWKPKWASCCPGWQTPGWPPPAPARGIATALLMRAPTSVPVRYGGPARRPTRSLWSHWGRWAALRRRQCPCQRVPIGFPCASLHVPDSGRAEWPQHGRGPKHRVGQDVRNIPASSVSDVIGSSDTLSPREYGRLHAGEKCSVELGLRDTKCATAPRGRAQLLPTFDLCSALVFAAMGIRGRAVGLASGTSTTASRQSRMLNRTRQEHQPRRRDGSTPDPKNRCGCTRGGS